MGTDQKGLEKNFPLIQWDWGAIHPHSVNLIAKYFNRVAEEFPRPIRLLRYVGVSTDQHFFGANRGGQPWASVVRNGTKLLLNAKWYGQTKKMLTNLSHNEISRFHPENTDSPAFPVVHELGHLLVDWLELQDKVAIQHDGEWKPLSVATRAWLRDHAGSKELSEYSLVNHREAWAEGFASLYFSHRLTPYARELQEFLRQAFDKSQWKEIKTT